jgi:uncharacterized protein YuzE
MRVTYDGQASAAYIYLKPTIEPGEATRTHVCDLRNQGFGLEVGVNLDFDVSGRLIGIEVLNASHGLDREFLRQAENIG